MGHCRLAVNQAESFFGSISMIGRALVFFLILAAISCGRSSRKEALNSLDTWYCSPPIDIASEDLWRKLPQSAIASIPKETERMAIQLLEGGPCRRLSRLDLAECGLGGAAYMDGHAPYLLRGLRPKLEGPNVRLSVLCSCERVWVKWDALSHSTPAIERRPLVAWLPFEPEAVFATVSLAE